VEYADPEAARNYLIYADPNFWTQGMFLAAALGVCAVLHLGLAPLVRRTAPPWLAMATLGAYVFAFGVFWPKWQFARQTGCCVVLDVPFVLVPGLLLVNALRCRFALRLGWPVALGVAAASVLILVLAWQAGELAAEGWACQSWLG